MAPRLSATRRPKTNPATRNPTGAPPRDAAPQDNAKAIEEAERVQLISFISRLTTADAEVEKAKAPYEAAVKGRRGVVNLAKAAGFTSEELKRRMDEMNRSSGDNALQEARERKHRRWLGIVTPEQSKMHLEPDTPQEARDEVDAETEGYKAGLRGLAAKMPENMNARFLQPFLRGHERGTASSTAQMMESAPKQLPVREQAAKDFAEDNAPEPGSPEALKAEREAIAKAKDSLAAMQGDASEEAEKINTPEEVLKVGQRVVITEQVEGGPATGEYTIASGPAPDDAFEATPEELAAQSTRQAIVAVREAGEEEAVV